MPSAFISRLLHRPTWPTKAAKTRAKALTGSIEASGIKVHRWWPNRAGGLEATWDGFFTRVPVAITITARGRVNYSALGLDSKKRDRVLWRASDEEVIAALYDDLQLPLGVAVPKPLTSSSAKK